MKKLPYDLTALPVLVTSPDPLIYAQVILRETLLIID